MEIFFDKYRSGVAEGPIWDDDNNRLIFLDILGKCIFFIDYESGEVKKTDVGQMIGCMALCENGDMLVALEDGIYRLNPNGEMTLAHQKIKIKGQRFNDGKVGPDGCFYLGTSDSECKGAFYRLKDGVLTELFDGCGCSNGLDWTLDETKMIYCDTPKQKIEVFDFDIKNSALSNRRTFVEIDKSIGTPDGLAMDSEDNIWLALWGGNAVIEIKKDGSFGKKIDVPAIKASCCCFAGKELKDLIITSASKGDEVDYPLAGYVFKINMEIKGKCPYKYKY